MYRIVKSIEIERTLVIVRALGQGGWGVTASGVTCWGEENVLKLEECDGCTIL